MRVRSLFLSIVLCFVFASMSFGAMNVYLTLTGEWQGWIRGDSSLISMERENTIEAVGYTHMLAAEPDPLDGRASFPHHHFPVTIIKQFDKSSPHLFKAWAGHESCTAVFRFYRPNPIGDGTTEQFYTVTLTEARISGIRQEVLNNLDPATNTKPPLERISFTYSDITEEWMDGGYVYNDRWRNPPTRNVPLSDVNFDGIVNMKDYAIMADDWLTQY